MQPTFKEGIFKEDQKSEYPYTTVDCIENPHRSKQYEKRYGEYIKDGLSLKVPDATGVTPHAFADFLH